MLRPSYRSCRRALVTFAVIGALAAGIPVRPAGADSIEDKRAEARQLSARLDELDARVSELDEDYNETRLRLAEIEAELAKAEAGVDRSEAARSAHVSEVKQYAVTAYMSGSEASDVVTLFRGDGGDLPARENYLRAAAGDGREAIDDLRSVLEDLELKVAETARLRAEVEGIVGQLDARRDEIEAVIAEQQDLLSGVEAELDELILAEQARQEAQRAEAARRAAASSTTSSSSSSSSSTSQGPAAAADDSSSTSAPPPVNEPPPPAPSGGVGAVLAEARRLLGTPYQWAGSTPSSGFDCSGFTAWVWSRAGVSLPHSSRAQYGATRRVSMSQLQPGDLVFFGSPIHHVGLYVGGGQMIDSPRTGDVVRYHSIHRGDFAGGGRVIG